MENSIYLKLQKMRTGIRKEEWESFSEFVELVEKKAKYYKVIVLYCFYDKVATLTLLDMDNISMCIKFQIPADMVGMKNVKQYLYYMAFNLAEVKNTISTEELLYLLERMKEKKVTEKQILERYSLNSLAEMTTEIYKGCLTVLSKMKKTQEGHNG